MKIPAATESAVPGMDVTAARRWQARSHLASAWLHEEVASRMAERLAWFREQPASWLHWEPVAGGVDSHRKVVERLPQARCLVAANRMDEALKVLAGPSKALWHPSRWTRVRGPVAAEPETQVDMVWANMVLHHEPLPQTLLRRWHQHVAVDGFLMFSCLGPDSLRELRQVYRQGGWPEPAHAFTDMHDWGDMLVHSGFAEPVMDMERIVLTYSGAVPLLADLRQMGRNLQPARFQGLRGRGWQTRLHEALQDGLPRTPDGRLQLTFEVIYGHAFKPRPRVSVEREQQVSVEDMRAMLRTPRR